MEASSPSEAAIARVPTPDRTVPQIMVVGPPFRNADPIVKLIPVHEDKTVMPKATAGFNERYRLERVLVVESTLKEWRCRALRRVSQMSWHSPSAPRARRHSCC
jgi:hypothetical protein